MYPSKKSAKMIISTLWILGGVAASLFYVDRLRSSEAEFFNSVLILIYCAVFFGLSRALLGKDFKKHLQSRWKLCVFAILACIVNFVVVYFLLWGASLLWNGKLGR